MTDIPMPKDRRKQVVLDFLARTDLALPPRAVYTNLYREGTPFGEKSVRRYLSELEDEGLVRRLDDPSTYYVITEAGRKTVQSAE